MQSGATHEAVTLHTAPDTTSGPGQHGRCNLLSKLFHWVHTQSAKYDIAGFASSARGLTTGIFEQESPQSASVSPAGGQPVECAAGLWLAFTTSRQTHPIQGNKAVVARIHSHFGASRWLTPTLSGPRTMGTRRATSRRRHPQREWHSRRLCWSERRLDPSSTVCEPSSGRALGGHALLAASNRLPRCQETTLHSTAHSDAHTPLIRVRVT